MTTAKIVRALDSGQRERAALLSLWNRRFDAGTIGRPFWWYLEAVTYDPVTDTFTLPDGETIAVQGINEEKP